MIYTIYNSIITPDGTYLTCEHNHDFKVHLDKVSGETYMNDGLGYCIRRSVNKAPYIDFAVNSEHDHELQRKYFKWGTYGKDGKQEKKYVLLKDMSNLHIENILITQHPFKGTYVEELLMNELAYRKDNNILIED